MGWCHEFGSQIHETCGHPMTAGDSSCSCATCGVVCLGRFSACSTVWERGPRRVNLVRPVVAAGAVVTLGTNGGEPAPAPERSAVPEPVDRGRGEVLEWLQSAFEGVRSDLAQVMDAVSRQQEGLATLTRTEAAIRQLVLLAEALPGRVCATVADAVAGAAAPTHPADASFDAAMMAEEMGKELRHSLPGYIDDAVRDIVRPGQGAMMNRVDEVTAELRDSLAEVQASAAELRNEMARLAAFRAALVADQPELAEAVEAATERADERLTALAQKVESLGDRPELQTVQSHLPFRPESAPEW